jgi:presenilin-like A22 family membrane protease
VIDLAAGIGEAYTPTLIGADGSVFAINDATLYNIVPEPASAPTLMGGAILMLATRRINRHASATFYATATL